MPIYLQNDLPGVCVPEKGGKSGYLGEINSAPEQELSRNKRC